VERETEREKQIETERNREKQRETERNREKQRETDRNREKQRETDRNRERKTQSSHLTLDEMTAWRCQVFPMIGHAHRNWEQKLIQTQKHGPKDGQDNKIPTKNIPSPEINGTMVFSRGFLAETICGKKETDLEYE
jgi:hypothetical protein